MSQPGDTVNLALNFIWSGAVEKWFDPYGPVGTGEVRAVFNSRRSEARIQCNRDFAYGNPVTSPGPRRLYIPTLFSTNYQTFNFQGPESLISVTFLTNQVTEGAAAILRFSRPALTSQDPPALLPALTLPFQLDGGADLGSDYSLVPASNISVTFAFGAPTADLPLQALSDGLGEGWESVYVRLDPVNPDYSPDTRAGSNWMAALNIRDPGVTGTPAPLDNDEDGMTDDFERAFGRNPFVFDDPYTDQDGDGMPDMEESLAGTNPNTRDSDNDGLDDYAEWTHGSNATNATENLLRPASDYASVKLAAASCYKCHETTLQVGPSALTSARPVRGQYAGDTRREQIFQFLKGASYPINISGPVTGDPTGRYTAEILVPTNGVPPEFFVNDPDGMLGVGLSTSNLVAKVATLTVPKVELTWTNKGDNLALDDHTNAVNKLVQGKRIFVGAKTTNENNARNTLMLYIKTTPPLVGSNVWVRSFDVDDTTDDKRFDNAGVIDTTGRLGEDNFNDYLNTPKPGMFVANGSSSYSTILDANGEALVEFRVGMQPGNNYRIAATVFPTSQLNSLQSSTAADGYVSAYTDKISSGFNGLLSPLLTVWRKLHLEIDSMTAPPASGPQGNFVSGKIIAVKPNQPNAGQTKVYFSFGGASWQENQFEDGSLTIAAIGSSNTVLRSSTVTYPGPYGWQQYQNFVIVAGLVPTNVVNAAYVLRDDDDSYLVDWTLPPPLPFDGRHAEAVDAIRPVFQRGFIEVTDANAIGLNPVGRTQIPFILNYALNPILNPVGGHFIDAQDIFDSARFWSHTVCFAYQAGLNDCRDPNPDPNDPDADGPTLGVTPKGVLNRPGVSGIYVESIRDQNLNVRQPGVLPGSPTFDKIIAVYKNDFLGVVAHEIGHMPGNELEAATHNEGGIMMRGSANLVTGFSSETIRRFRKNTSWTIPGPEY